MRCRLVRDGRDCVCEVCGRRVASGVDCADIIAKCDAWAAGDDLENLLHAVGVFKERWVAFKQAFGLPPTCNCDKRKEWLNQASANLHVSFKRLQGVIEDYYSKPR